MIIFDGFDEDSVSFTLTGRDAMELAARLGDTQGYKPNRTNAVCSVTLYGDRLTDEFCNDKITSNQEGDRDLFSQCSDVECG